MARRHRLPAAALALALAALALSILRHSPQPAGEQARRTFECPLEPEGPRRDACTMAQAEEVARSSPEDARRICTERLGDTTLAGMCLARVASSSGAAGGGALAGAAVCDGERRDPCLLDLARTSAHRDPQGALAVCRAMGDASLRDSCLSHVASTRRLDPALAREACGAVAEPSLRERCRTMAGG